MHDAAKGVPSTGFKRGCHTLPQRGPPQQELARGIDRQEPDGREQRELGDERNAVEVVGRTLLELEHPQEPHDENHACGEAEHRIDAEKRSCVAERQLTADQNELDRERAHQGERRDVMEKCKETAHAISRTSR